MYNTLFPKSTNHQFIINLSELETVSIAQLKQDSKSDNTQTRISAAINPKLPIIDLEKLAQDTNELVRIAVAINPQTTTSILDKLASDNSTKIREIVASNLRTPINTLIKLTSDKSLQVQVAIIRNLNTPINIIAQLSGNLKFISNLDIKHAIADRIKFIPEELEYFSQVLKNLLSSVDEYVIQKLEIFPQLLQNEYKHKYSYTSLNMLRLDMFLNLAKNNTQTFSNNVLRQLRDSFLFDITTPRQIIDEIANLHVYLDKFNNVNFNLIIVRHPHTSIQTLIKLASHQNAKIRIAVAKRQDTPANTLLQLLQDHDYNVRYTAILTCEQHFFDDKRFQDLIIAWKEVNNPHTSNQTLEQLATSKCLIVREAIAKNPKTSLHILEQLVEDVYVEIRLAVANNPNTTSNLLEQILANLDRSTKNLNIVRVNQEIQIAVAKHPNTCDAVLEKLVHDYSYKEKVHQVAVKNLILRQSPRVEGIFAKYIEESTSSLIKISVLLQPLTSVDMLTQYSRSLLWWERYAVATNPRTPLNVREKLTQDGNKLVRTAARANSL